MAWKNSQVAIWCRLKFWSIWPGLDEMKIKFVLFLNRCILHPYQGVLKDNFSINFQIFGHQQLPKLSQKFTILWHWRILMSTLCHRSKLMEAGKTVVHHWKEEAIKFILKSVTFHSFLMMTSRKICFFWITQTLQMHLKVVWPGDFTVCKTKFKNMSKK